MDQEKVRLSFNKFLKMYFDSCREVYEELDYKELTGKQFSYLRKIDKSGEISMGDLADAFELSKPTVTEMIRKFDETGLIQKRRCETDGRVSYISLSPKGQLLANTNELESKRAVEKIFARLSEEEIATLTTLFNKIGQV